MLEFALESSLLNNASVLTRVCHHVALVGYHRSFAKLFIDFCSVGDIDNAYIRDLTPSDQKAMQLAVVCHTLLKQTYIHACIYAI